MKRLNYISLLNVISCFAVVMLHTNGCFWNFSNESYWFTANIIESVMYFAVPVFFMISGATLMDYRERYSTKDFFAKRIRKTVIPFLIWSCIGLVYLCLKDKSVTGTLGIRSVISMVLTTKIVGIYWFFIPLFAVYLSIPVLSSIPKTSRNTIFKYITAVSFCTISLFPFLCSLLGIQYNGALSLPVGGGYILYVVLGYLLANTDLDRRQRGLIYILSIIGLMMHICGTYYLSVRSGEIVQTFKGYLNVPCVLYSTGIFVLFKYHFDWLKRTDISKLSKYSFPVYILHYFVMDFFTGHFSINTYSIYYRVFFPFVIISICVAFTYLIRKIPYLKNILP